MSTVNSAIKDFLSQKRIAVAGISATREVTANFIYRKLRSAGYQVFAITPKAKVFDGDPCYADLRSLPEQPEGVVIVTRPAITDKIVRECIDLGIPRVWMHCSLGTHPRFAAKMAAATTSVSLEAVRLCRENRVSVIPGGCPMMFCQPVDFGHKCMRGIMRLTGNFAD